MKVDRKRLGFGLGLAAVAGFSLALAGASWPGSPAGGCAEPDRSDRFILECVAEQARGLEPDALTLLASLTGTAVLLASVVVGLSAMRRVITIAEAAEELGTSPGDVRTLIDQGKLEVHAREPGTVYLNPEDVRRLAAARDG